MLLIIDNYDSFTYNLVQYFGELQQSARVLRNDCIDIAGIRELDPHGIVISPGPCTPNEAGVSVDVVKEFTGEIPILGVCLGHQSICHALGGNVVRADQVMHGKVSEIYHHENNLFDGIENPFTATRYHSLVAEPSSLPDCLEVTAWTNDGIIMGVKHREFDVYGVQFHPESFLTPVGHDVLRNFLIRGGLSA